MDVWSPWFSIYFSGMSPSTRVVLFHSPPHMNLPSQKTGSTNSIWTTIPREYEAKVELLTNLFPPPPGSYALYFRVIL